MKRALQMGGFRAGVKLLLSFPQMLRYQFKVLKYGSWDGLLVYLTYLEQRPDALHVICRKLQIPFQPAAM